MAMKVIVAMDDNFQSSEWVLKCAKRGLSSVETRCTQYLRIRFFPVLRRIPGSAQGYVQAPNLVVDDICLGPIFWGNLDILQGPRRGMEVCSRHICV